MKKIYKKILSILIVLMLVGCSNVNYREKLINCYPNEKKTIQDYLNDEDCKALYELYIEDEEKSFADLEYSYIKNNSQTPLRVKESLEYILNEADLPGKRIGYYRDFAGTDFENNITIAVASEINNGDLFVSYNYDEGAPEVSFISIIYDCPDADSLSDILLMMALFISDIDPTSDPIEILSNVNQSKSSSYTYNGIKYTLDMDGKLSLKLTFE